MKAPQQRYAQSEKGKAKKAEYRQAHHEELLMKKKIWYQKNRKAILDKQRDYNKETYQPHPRLYIYIKKQDKDALMFKALLRAYGPDAKKNYIEAWCKQDGWCAICLKTLKFLARTTHYDHDHITGKFRGLLCNNCNTGLGHFKDSINNCQFAANYLAGGVPSGQMKFSQVV